MRGARDAAVDSPTMKTVLVVDDAPNIVELLRLYLEQAGYATIAAADGPTAIELHRRHRPDLVVLDVMLPGLDGFEVCRAIRREADTPHSHAHGWRSRRRRRHRGSRAGRGRLRHQALSTRGRWWPG